MTQDNAHALWWSMHLVPAALTMVAVFYFRGIRLVVSLLGIAFVGWMLVISAAEATENVMRGNTSGGCGMVSGIALMCGWVYGVVSVGVWTAVAFLFRWMIESAILVIRRSMTKPPLAN